MMRDYKNLGNYESVQANAINAINFTKSFARVNGTQWGGGGRMLCPLEIKNSTRTFLSLMGLVLLSLL